MGEIRGGEGRAAGPTVINCLASALRAERQAGREIGQIVVKRVTEGLLSFEITYHGQPEPEELVYFGAFQSDDIATPSPIGGSSPSPEED